MSSGRACVIALLLGFTAALACAADIGAKDGFGNDVDWFFVIKLSKHTFPAEELQRVRASADPDYHNQFDDDASACDCPDPTCVGGKDGGKTDYGSGRGSGLCYLYADSNNPKLRYFRDVKDGSGKALDCLGQGGNDPISQTMKQMYEKRDDSYWTFWNDDFSGTADSYKDGDDQLPHGGNKCGSGYGHSKGTLCMDDKGGYLLSGTTPNFPDPSLGDKFAPLGCQLDDNTIVSQSFYGVTLDTPEFEKLGKAVAVSKLCSTNTISCASGSNGHMHSGWECASEKTNNVMNDGFSKAKTTEHSQKVEIKTRGGMSITLSAKSHLDQIPPWVLVAGNLNTDMSVATWWDSRDGQPNVCRADDVSVAEKDMCVFAPPAGISPTSKGTPEYNVENIISLTFPINGKDRAWGMWGGPWSTANHGKWGVASPASGSVTPWVVPGDMNMQGFPCSSGCSGSQNGRGGMFIGFQNKDLWDSITGAVSMVCTCGDESAASNRFCGMGCMDHAVKALSPKPKLGSGSKSFWDKEKDKVWSPLPLSQFDKSGFEEQDGSNTTPIIVGSVFGVLFAVLGAMTVVFVARRRRGHDGSDHDVSLTTPSLSHQVLLE